ncbi:MAG: PAS domain S-box protein, partial [Chloroflexi bacterium]|nr:PAS domain S-box protein [Chloroflexota bacterium]
MSTIGEREQTELKPAAGKRVSGKLSSNAALRDAYQQLELSELRYRDLYDRAPDMYHTLDLTGNFVEFNPKHTEVLGYTSGELEHSHISSIMIEDMLTQLAADFQDVITNGNINGREYILKRKDGSSMTVEVHAMRFDGPDGEPQEVRCIMRDITPRKALEAQLLQAQKMESIGQLAGGIAHDFNNLLTAIGGYTQMALATPSDYAKVQEYLGQVQQASERASNLTKQLLAFSRRQIIAPKVINVNEVVTNTERILQRFITENIELTSVLAEDLGQVNIDPTQVEQILINLVVNARDAMPDGGSLTIRTQNELIQKNTARQHPDLSAGEYVLLTVSDSGTGIDEAIQSRIFDPFFTTKEEGKGTGLGLSMCYGIIRQNDGHICVESQLGRGSTFKVLIPRVADSPMPLALAPREERSTLAIGTEAILLVEDDSLVRGLGAEVLRRQGYHVLEAAHGKEAVQVAQNHDGEIHLMLTDVIMPNMSAKELTGQIKDSRPAIKVLFTSGYANDEVVRQGVL